MKKQKKSPWKILVFPLVMAGTGAAAGYFGGVFLKSFLPSHGLAPVSTGEKIGLVALVFFAGWVTIAFHELGHLTAGLAQGFRMALYTAGFLGARGTERGVRFFFNRHINLLGGLAATFPEQLESGPELRRKFVRIVAAGPLASLVLSAATGLALLAVLPGQGESTDVLTRLSVVFLLFTSVTSGLIFVLTMIPNPSGGFMSDGARLLSLLRGGEKSRYEEATLTLAALLGAGTLPGEYPADLLERLVSRSPDSLLGLNGHFTAFSHHLDRGETAQALPLAQIIEDHISAVPAAFQPHYLKDVVFFYAFLIHDADAAAACWASIQKQAEREPDAATFRVKAALAILHGQTEAATGFLEKGFGKISDLPFEGQRRFEEKWLREVSARLQEQQPAVAAG